VEALRGDGETALPGSRQGRPGGPTVVAAAGARRGGRQRIPRPAEHRPGAPPPWAALRAGERRLRLADVRERLTHFPAPHPATVFAPGSRPAAVLLPLYEVSGEVHVVLTKRPEHLPSHRGEIAFPGGTFQSGVDAGPLDTALREAHEEVGLPPGAVDVAAELDSLGTVASRFVITPFVGLLPAEPLLVPAPGEVERAFSVPLSTLADPERFREEWWRPAGDDPVAVILRRDTGVDAEGEFPVFFYELDDETIWGATARILTTFLARLLLGAGY